MMVSHTKWIAILLACLVLPIGCKSESSKSRASRNREFKLGESEESKAERQKAKQAADLKVLFIGNSHTLFHGLPMRFADLVHSDGSNIKVFVDQCVGSSFLDAHSKSQQTLERVKEGGWDYVVLQAQKYSTTGKYRYPIDGALTLGKLAQEQGAKVLMFPEWGRRGNLEEAARIQKLHQKIAKELDCQVVPVGLAWDEVLKQGFGLELHASDGNHSSEIGAYLTACVFYAHIRQRDPQGLSSLNIDGLAKNSATLLQEAAWKVVNENRNPNSTPTSEVTESKGK